MAADLKIVPVDDEDRKGLIAGLEELLQQAKDGEVYAVYYVARQSDGLLHNKWIGKSYDRLVTVGALEHLKADLMNS